MTRNERIASHPEPVRRRAGAHASAPAILLVGASTGGPQALATLMRGLSSVADHLPVCVTLHMPSDLMPIVSAHVMRSSGIPTHIVDGPVPLRPGLVYFAPGHRHLDVRAIDGNVEIRLKTGVPKDYCKPAIDSMFVSAAACFGTRALAIVLSGMGTDGLAGARAIVAAGGRVIVQDKTSSAVWGMPGAVVKAGLSTAVLAPVALAEEVVRRVGPPERRA